ncbi:MAG: hypothetical protein IT376_15805 [Polyangiaceae bacterium]|nr:hypothetical protein [Polyangiaceae bacterium]
MTTPAFGRRSLLALGAGAALGCGSAPEKIVYEPGRVDLPAAALDRDPLALLPSKGVGYFRVDCRALFASRFGERLLAIVRGRAPVPPSAGFEPARDLETIHGGVFALAGADLAAVATGRFEPAKIESAADGVQQTPFGAPVVRSQYAGRGLYTAANVGFSVLTPRTVLFGNETGIRRALDRVAIGKLSRSVPRWMEKLLATQGAPIVGGMDLAGHDLTDVLSQELAFLDGAEALRALVDLEPPGINVAGSITYPDEAAAGAALARLRANYAALTGLSMFAGLVGLENPIRRFSPAPRGREITFEIGLDGDASSRMLDKFADRLLGALPLTPAGSAP